MMLGLNKGRERKWIMIEAGSVFFSFFDSLAPVRID